LYFKFVCDAYFYSKRAKWESVVMMHYPEVNLCYCTLPSLRPVPFNRWHPSIWIYSKTVQYQNTSTTIILHIVHCLRCN